MTIISIDENTYYEYDITLQNPETGADEKFISDKDNIFSPNHPIVLELDLDDQDSQKEMTTIFHSTFINWIYPKIIINYPEVFKRNLEYLHRVYSSQKDHVKYQRTEAFHLRTIFKEQSSKDIENHPRSYCRYNFIMSYVVRDQDDKYETIPVLYGNIYLCK